MDVPWFRSVAEYAADVRAVTVDLRCGDCLDVLRELEDASVDAVVTDPPYGISFMGKHWDRFDIEKRVGKRDVSQLGVRLTGGHDSPNRKETTRTTSAYANAAGAAGGYDFSAKGNRAFQQWVEQWATECLRVLKPGGHLLSFGGTRTYHRLASGLEDAGFEIRDCLAWMFGSGFPKSLDVSKAIDAKAGILRGQAGAVISENGSMGGTNYERTAKGDPVTAAAAAWDGWGTALKPAFEPIVLARKPPAGTVAANVLEYGTGALNVDACRIEGSKGDGNWKGTGDADPGFMGGWASVATNESPLGRWPANVLLDEEAARMLDAQTGELHARGNVTPTKRGSQGVTWYVGPAPGPIDPGDAGGASRFFYCAKVLRAERNAGLDGFKEALAHDDVRLNSSTEKSNTPQRNVHPTVKPIDLMRWLIRLVTPPDGVVLDPFLGSGSTGCAATLEGVRFIGIEREPDYMRIAEARIRFWTEHGEAGLEIARARDAAAEVLAEIADAGQTDIFTALAEGSK